MKGELAKGWTCKCGHFNPFGVWVYAHWKETLKGTCGGCKQSVMVRAGKVVNR